MGDVPRSPKEGDDADLAREMAAIPYEPLMPVEKKLIGWSIGLGLALLGLLMWVSFTFFPVGHGG
jgi:hypothetical protein